MADIEPIPSSNLEWLALLPDFDMNLSIQDLGPKLFPLFSKLPPEPKNKVWRAFLLVEQS